MRIKYEVVCLYKEVFMFNKILGIFLSILAISSYETCYGRDSHHSRARTSRDQLSSALKSVTVLEAFDVPHAISLADKCIEICDNERLKAGAIEPGVLHIKGQANFLKGFLIALQEVQTLNPGEHLSEDSKKALADGDRLYRRVVGHLVVAANAKIQQLEQTVAADAGEEEDHGSEVEHEG